MTAKEDVCIPYSSQLLIQPCSAPEREGFWKQAEGVEFLSSHLAGVALGSHALHPRHLAKALCLPASRSLYSRSSRRSRSVWHLCVCDPGLVTYAFPGLILLVQRMVFRMQHL